MRSIIAATLATIALVAGTVPAPAVTLVVNGTTRSVRWQRFVDREMFIPTVRAKIALHLATPCPGSTVKDAAGCTIGDGIWIAKGPAVAVGETLRHELGHVFEDRYLTVADRSAFTRIWSPAPASPSGLWDGTPGDYQWATAAPAGHELLRYHRIRAERFAETYAVCSLYSSNAQITSAAMSASAFDVLRAPGWTLRGFVVRMRRSCTLIRRVGVRAGAAPGARPRPEKRGTFDLG